MSELDSGKTKKITWTVWVVFLTVYICLNAWSILKAETDKLHSVALGWGIIMPILSNLSWWAIGFRLRNRLPNWWFFGLATAFCVGIAGVVTMWRISLAQ